MQTETKSGAVFYSLESRRAAMIFSGHLCRTDPLSPVIKCVTLFVWS